MRLDSFLVDKNLAKSRTFAKTLIEKEFVKVNNQIVTKASFNVEDCDSVEVTGAPYNYVGRGGVKLEKALNSFDIDVSNYRCVDIGSSSGGFTDCLLKRGAAIVYAVDSGTNQLDVSLVNNEKVISIESFNAKKLTLDILDNKPVNIAVCDVSFISQTHIIPVVPELLSLNGVFVSLVKPQFECGREGIKKGGIVKNNIYRINALEKVIKCANDNNLGCTGLISSPILGGDGNQEFLIVCEKGKKATIDNEYIRKVVLE